MFFEYSNTPLFFPPKNDHTQPPFFGTEEVFSRVFTLCWKIQIVDGIKSLIFCQIWALLLILTPNQVIRVLCVCSDQCENHVWKDSHSQKADLKAKTQPIHSGEYPRDQAPLSQHNIFIANNFNDRYSSQVTIQLLPFVNYQKCDL